MLFTFSEALFFLRILGHLKLIACAVNGLYVLSASENGFDNGCIINTFSQVTDTPLRVSVTINKSNKTCEMIERTGKFNVSILSEDVSFDTFKHFGFQSGRDVNKFDGYTDVKRSENGILYLTSCSNGFVSGKVIQTIDVGTHLIFIAEVEDCDILSDVPSVTYDYYHKNIKPKPQEEKKGGYRCKICGYVYEGEPLPADFICPLCKHGADDFEKI